MQALARCWLSRLPVVDEKGDVVGIVTLFDLFRAVSRREAVDLKAMLREVPVVNDRMEALDVMEALRRTEHRIALVYDEWGHFEGIITASDLLEAITGAVAAAEDGEPALLERADGSLLVAGWMPADEMADLLGLSLPEPRGCSTMFRGWLAKTNRTTGAT